MNLLHYWICRSGWWKCFLKSDLIPWALKGIEQGERVLEIGPGPGLTTALLAPRTGELVCLEVDPRLATSLHEECGSQFVRVICGNATEMALRSGAFDYVVAFTMLHHVKPASAQDALFREAARVLRPEGLLAGTDSLDSPIFRILHWRDDLEAMQPETLERRLREAGFARVEIAVRKREFRFRAWRAKE